MALKSQLSFSCSEETSQDSQTTACLVLIKSFLYEASPLKLPFHINTQACPDLASCGTAALSGYTPQVTTPDNQTRTHAWPTNFYSLYLIWLQNLGEEGRPPGSGASALQFLLPPPPPPLSSLLYLHMPGSGTNQRAAWDALNWGCHHFITKALCSPRLGDKGESSRSNVVKLQSGATRMGRQMLKYV